MSINKFGQHLKRSDNHTSLPGPPGIGFKLTDDGNYNIEQRRLVNLNSTPKEENDAVCKEYVDQLYSSHKTQVIKFIKQKNTSLLDTLNKNLNTQIDKFKDFVNGDIASMQKSIADTLNDNNNLNVEIATFTNNINDEIKRIQQNIVDTNENLKHSVEQLTIEIADKLEVENLNSILEETEVIKAYQQKVDINQKAIATVNDILQTVESSVYKDLHMFHKLFYEYNFYLHDLVHKVENNINHLITDEIVQSNDLMRNLNIHFAANKINKIPYIERNLPVITLPLPPQIDANLQLLTSNPKAL